MQSVTAMHHMPMPHGPNRKEQDNVESATTNLNISQILSQIGSSLFSLPPGVHKPTLARAPDQVCLAR